MPTVLNLLGVKAEYQFGSDLLNVENNLVVFRMVVISMRIICILGLQTSTTTS